MQAQIEARVRELIAKDGLSPLQAWNQACKELGAMDQPGPLDQPSGVKLTTPNGQTPEAAIARFKELIHGAQSYGLLIGRAIDP